MKRPDEAVPYIRTSATAEATVVVTPQSVTIAEMRWSVPVVRENPVIGLHIHVGDMGTNGGILVGFCGQNPLPPFSGACPHATSSRAEINSVEGEACTLGGPPKGPCVVANGATISAAASAILSSGDQAHDKYYLNLHTNHSFNLNKAHGNGPLGLIRGQLEETSC